MFAVVEPDGKLIYRKGSPARVAVNQLAGMADSVSRARGPRLTSGVSSETTTKGIAANGESTLL
jgi:hypothetical protein